MYNANINLINSNLVNERVILTCPFYCTQLQTYRLLILTNLRLCFAKDYEEPLHNIYSNKVKFIPLDYIDLKIGSNTLIKQMSGHDNKIRVEVDNFIYQNKFEML